MQYESCTLDVDEVISEALRQMRHVYLRSQWILEAFIEESCCPTHEASLLF